MKEANDEPDRTTDQEAYRHLVEGAGDGAGAQDEPDSDYEARACDAYERAGARELTVPWDGLCTTSAVPFLYAGGGRQNVLPAIIIPPDRQDIPAEVTVGEITGWRFWYADDYELRSWAADYYWNPGINETDIRHNFGGFHCYKLKSAAAAQSVWRAGFTAGVIGEIECWGTVYEHVDGYRAEFARIKSLYVRTYCKLWGRRRFQRQLRRRYGLPDR